MKKFLASLTALSALAPMALAEMQFDIALDDMVNNVTCFNQSNCGPAEGLAWVKNLGNQTTYEVPIAFTGPDGFPLAYQFVMQGDEIVPVGGNQIDSLYVNWSGPGFRYTFAQDFAPLTYFYFHGPATPPENPTPIAPGEEGCYNPPIPEDWTWANFPNGIVELAQHLGIRQHLPGVAASQFEQAPQKRGLVHAGEQQHVAGYRGFDQRVEQVAPPPW